MAKTEWVKVAGGGKGKPGIYTINGLYVLRWSYARKRYTLALGHDRLKLAQAVAAKIEADIVAGHFDVSLEAYRPKPVKPAPKVAKRLTDSELWGMFVESRRQSGTSGGTITAKYRSLGNLLMRWGRWIESSTQAKEFMDYLRNQQSANTSNENLGRLKAFGRWCVLQGHWQENYFAAIPPVKGGQRLRKNSFTAAEVIRFLQTIKTDKDYWHYHDFCYCLFHLGCRPSELIGLRWQHIDFNRRVITICESLSRGDDGKAAGYARKRKATKTGNIRYLPMTETVYSLLEGRFQDCQPQSGDDLVFTALRGGPIDDNNFRERCWKSICQRAGIPYRSPYIARHTALSHIVENTGSLAQAAAVAGHSSLRMVSQTYGHLVTQIRMPEYES